MVRVTLIAASQPLYGIQDPKRLVEVAVKTSSGKVREKGFMHYFFADRDKKDLDKWLIDAAERFPSVLEHITLTFMIEDISRVTSHQLVRHRIASYTQESMRYSVLDVEGWLAIASDRHLEDADKREIYESLFDSDLISIPLSIRAEVDWEEVTKTIESSFRLYKKLVEEGVPPEDARWVLPMGIKTRIMMTLNLRELLHISCMRLRPGAQWEIREVVFQMAEEVYEKLKIPIEDMVHAYCGCC